DEGSPRLALRHAVHARRWPPDGLRRRGRGPAGAARARQPDVVVLLPVAAREPAAARAARDRAGPHRHGALGEAVDRRLPAHPGPTGRRLRRVRRRARPDRAGVARRPRLGRGDRPGLGRRPRRARGQAAGPQHRRLSHPAGQDAAVVAGGRPRAGPRGGGGPRSERLQPGSARHGHRPHRPRPGGQGRAHGALRQPGLPGRRARVRPRHPDVAARPGLRRPRPHRVAAAPAAGQADGRLLGDEGPGVRRDGPGPPAGPAAEGRGAPLPRRRPLRARGRRRPHRPDRGPAARSGV
ncbi:MAG: Haloalkane dehalogenase-like protein, partial [uncultured Frankineae bacterium]